MFEQIIILFLSVSFCEQKLRMRFIFRNNETNDMSGLGGRNAVIQPESNVTFASGPTEQCASSRSVQFTGERGSYLEMPPKAVNDIGSHGIYLSLFFFVDTDMDHTDEWCRSMWLVKKEANTTDTEIKMCVAQDDRVYLFQKGYSRAVVKTWGHNVIRGGWNWLALQGHIKVNRAIKWHFYLNRIFTSHNHHFRLLDFHDIPAGGHLMGGDNILNGYFGLKGRMTHIHLFVFPGIFPSIPAQRFLNKPACHGDHDLFFHYPLNNTQNNVTDISPNMRGEAPIGPNVSLALLFNGQLSCVYFDGSAGSYIRLPSSEVQGLTDFTIAFWVKVVDMSQDQDIISLLAQDRFWFREFDHEISVRVEDSQIVASVFSFLGSRHNYHTAYPKVIIPTEHFDNASFNHLTVTLKGSTLSVSINGTHTAATTLSMVFPLSAGYTDTFLVGQRAHNRHGHLHEDFPFHGYITDLRMYQVGINVSTDFNFKDTVTQQPPLIPLPPPAPERQINTENITQQAWFAPVITGVVISALLLFTAFLVVFRRHQKKRRMGSILSPNMIDQSHIVQGSLSKLQDPTATNNSQSKWSELSRVEVEQIDQIFFPMNSKK